MIFDRLVEREVAVMRVAMEGSRQVSHPRFRDSFAIEHAHERVGIRMRYFAEWIRADQRRDVERHGCNPGKAPGGNIRAALRHLMSSRSGPFTPITSSAHSLASPVSSVRSAPQTIRVDETAANA
jgi:hypothetical protein